ncbi:MAG: hypothetical protein QOJ99_4974 [Bryobacterales bacterium]|nr:hypothetical protein [Bryobacterales bacterium]
MSSFCKISIGKTPGATRANAMYITRTGACDLWETRNIPDEEHLGITRDDQRRSIADYLSGNFLLTERLLPGFQLGSRHGYELHSLGGGFAV